MDKNLKHRLLGNIPIPLKDICFVHSLKIKEILYDIDKYETMLSNLIIELKDIIPDKKELVNISTFDIIVFNILGDQNGEYLKYILNAIKTFVKADVTFYYTPLENLDEIPNNAYFIIGDSNKPEECKFLGKEDYDYFKYILKKSNCLKNPEKEKYNPAGAMAQSIIDKIKKREKFIEKQKIEFEGELQLCDTISAVVAKSNSLNMVDIGKLNLYQLYDQLEEIQMIEEYEINIKSLLAGCDPDKINVKHYLRPKSNNV